MSDEDSSFFTARDEASAKSKSTIKKSPPAPSKVMDVGMSDEADTDPEEVPGPSKKETKKTRD